MVSMSTLHLAPGIHEAEITDFHEPGWEDVLEEAPHEFDHVERHGPPAIAFGLLVAKRDGSLFQLHNRAVGDGPLENVGGQVFEAG